MKNTTGYDVLIGCEYSGRVRQAMRDLGINAVSVDLLPSEDDSPHHIQADLAEFFQMPWRLAIFHPPCTRLCNSGVRWLHERNLWDDLKSAIALFQACQNANAPRVAVENPVMHKYARDVIGPASFSVQPWQFGDDAKKRTCFWTRGLPALRPTSTLDGSTAVAEVHTASPGPDRWKERSRTYPGIAQAIASQWGNYADLLTEAA